jgi:cytochrome oxidase assembly protein ShyY1
VPDKTDLSLNAPGALPNVNPDANQRQNEDGDDADDAGKAAVIAVPSVVVVLIIIGALGFWHVRRTRNRNKAPAIDIIDVGTQIAPPQDATTTADDVSLAGEAV